MESSFFKLLPRPRSELDINSTGTERVSIFLFQIHAKCFLNVTDCFRGAVHLQIGKKLTFIADWPSGISQHHSQGGTDFSLLC